MESDKFEIIEVHTLNVPEDEEWNVPSDILPEEGRRVFVQSESPEYPGEKFLTVAYIENGEWKEEWLCDEIVGEVKLWTPIPHPIDKKVEKIEVEE